MDIETFIAKWGTRGLKVIVADFISRAPDFPNSVAIAEILREATADLETALVKLDK